MFAQQTAVQWPQVTPLQDSAACHLALYNTFPAFVQCNRNMLLLYGKGKSALIAIADVTHQMTKELD